jgi:DNA-binding IclR family transcriptional regulator
MIRKGRSAVSSKHIVAAEDGTPNIKSLVKAITILEAFVGRERYLSLSEITKITEFDKSSVQRCTRTLLDIGYLEQNAETRRYALGKRVLDLSYTYLNSHRIIGRAAPTLVDLRQTARERVDLALQDGTDLLYVYRLQSKREAAPSMLVGRRAPMYSSAGGRAILSKMPENEAREILARSDLKAHTARTQTSIKSLLTAIRRTRMAGYALQVEEFRLGEISVGAAITDLNGQPIAAIIIAGSTNEWESIEFERKMGPLVAAAASELSGGA